MIRFETEKAEKVFKSHLWADDIEFEGVYHCQTCKVIAVKLSIGDVDRICKANDRNIENTLIFNELLSCDELVIEDIIR